ncbi:unnamed protein product, partial [marine sediment metagenome]
YSQMAGRAGRPQYDTEGFCYFVVKKDDDFVKFEDYKTGNLPRALSQINNDDYFFKAILELIHSHRTTDKEIIDFFKNSLFNFQAKKEIEGLIPHNLRNTIQTKMRKLDSAGILEGVGMNSKLTGFGKVIINYLFKGFSSPNIADFVSLKRYLERKKKVEIDFELIYFLSKRFEKYCTISKQPRKNSEEVLSFLRSRDITEKTSIEYSAYVVYKKWIENINEKEIEETCKVYTSNLSFKIWEMYKLLNVYKDLADDAYYPLPDRFQIFKERIRYGVQ